ncbi:MAG: hypothetical protein AAF702_23675 [Chloroflexota bacterium]
MTLWTLEYDKEVVQYLIGLRESGGEIRKVIKSLQNSFPEDAQKIQDIPETWEWLEARHWITFEIDRAKKWIYIADVSEISEVM